MPATSIDAMEIRKQWMRELGVSEDEIAEKCDPVRYPANLEDEMRNLQALDYLKEHRIRDILKNIAKSA